MPYYCYNCSRPRADCPPGHEEGGCAVVEAVAEEYRREKESGKYSFPSFATVRLRNQNEISITANEMTKEITETAKAEGREIQRKR